MNPALTRHLGVALLLGLAVVGVYQGSLNGPFIFDDTLHIVGNPGIRDLGNLQAVFHSGYQETRPVYLLTLALNYRAGELSPWGYHAVNLGLHWLCCLLLYALALGLARSGANSGLALDLNGPAKHNEEARPPGWGFAALSALVFAVHPLASESVAYVNARSGLLVALFGLAALLFFRRGHRCGGGPGTAKNYVLSTLFMLLAAGSKESAVSLPFLALLWLWLLPPAGVRRRPHPLAALPLLAPLVAVGLLWVSAENPHQDNLGAAALPWTWHLLTQARAVLALLRLCVLPLGQNFDHDFRPTTTLADPALWGALLLWALLLGGAWLLRRRTPLLSLGLGWFVLAIAPTNSVIPFAEFFAERYLYLPLIGVVLAAVWGITTLVARRPALGRILRLSGGAAITGLLLLTLLRVELLADPLALWQEAATLSPQKARPQLNYGIQLMRHGHPAEGLRRIRRSLELDPDYQQARYNLGLYHERYGAHLEQKGELDQALWHHKKAVELLRRAPHYARDLRRAKARLQALEQRLDSNNRR